MLLGATSGHVTRYPLRILPRLRLLDYWDMPASTRSLPPLVQCLSSKLDVCCCMQEAACNALVHVATRATTKLTKLIQTKLT